jgi:hypothetical protein
VRTSGCRHPGTQLDQPGRLRRRFRVPRQVQQIRRAPQQRRVAERLGRRDQQHLPRRRRQRAHPPGEAPLDLAGQRPGVRPPEPAGQFRRRQSPGQFQQGQWIAPRLRDDPVPYPCVEASGNGRVQQGTGVVVGQAADGQLRHSLPRRPGRRLADGEHDTDTLGEQAPRDEGQRLYRRLVEPLSVVDDAEQWPVLGHHRQQTQDGQSDQEPVRRTAGAVPERDGQRLPLRNRQTIPQVQHRPAQLMQTRVRQLHLGFDARRTRNPASGGRSHEVVEQDGFADSGLTTDQQGSAATRAYVVERPVQDRALRPPIAQFGPRPARHGLLHPAPRLEPSTVWR